jgi:hypothetical protein
LFFSCFQVRLAQQVVDTNNALLGMPVHVRSGHALLEAWSAGSAFREHDRRVQAAQQRRKELEDQKKEVGRAETVGVFSSSFFDEELILLVGGGFFYVKVDAAKERCSQKRSCQSFGRIDRRRVPASGCTFSCVCGRCLGCCGGGAGPARATQ